MTAAAPQSDAAPFGPFDAPVASLRGVGPARRKALEAKGLAVATDLLLLAPTRYAAPPPLGDPLEAPIGADLSFEGVVVGARAVRGRRGVSYAEIRAKVGVDEDSDSGVARVRYFNRAWLSEKAAIGTRALFSGRVKGGGLLSGVLFRPTPSPDVAPSFAPEPVHPKIAGVAEGVLRGLVREAIAGVAAVADPLPDDLREPLGLPRLSDALRRVHEPEAPEAAEEGGARLLFDRLVALARAAVPEKDDARAPSIRVDARVRSRIFARLPFAPTDDQRAAIEAIFADMERETPMRRLLLGDVGSGKTAVAVCALLAAVAASRQGLLLAPTDALAAQHDATLRAWLQGSRTRLAFLSSRTPRDERRRIAEALSEGGIDVLVGTHAALADDVAPPRLGLVVVDEQHRFGVLQRLSAGRKGDRPHLLALSATPIPRTLALALFGDLDATRLATRPSGRPPPTARLATSDAAFAEVAAAAGRGERAFVVYPTIKSEAAPSVEREGAALFRSGGPLAKVPGAILHGAMKAEARAEAMAAFREGRVLVLATTTIVEVGVDVPEATTMVVVGADRFGLATLHQLRGRVGRGALLGRVFLVAGGGRRVPADPKAAARLRLLESETDGLRLAEADLKLRGPGETCGVRQHGFGGALPLSEGRDRGFLEAAAAVARELSRRGYDRDRDAYYGRCAAALGGPRFDPPDAV